MQALLMCVVNTEATYEFPHYSLTRRGVYRHKFGDASRYVSHYTIHIAIYSKTLSLKLLSHVSANKAYNFQIETLKVNAEAA